MAFIPETAEWAEGIYQYEQDDVVEGGPDGIDNIQAKALAARTNYLKDLLENLQSDKQDQDPTLVAIAALATAADKFIYFTGEDQAALGTVTAFARSLLAGADAAAVRALLSAVSQAELNAAIAGLVNSSPATLDTLKELADALGDDPNFATTMTNALATRVQIADLQKGTHVTAMAGGAADAITGSYTPGITALTNGMTLYVRAVSANATTTPTFTPNSETIAAKQIVKGAGSALVAGDIAGGGHWAELQYDATLDKWVMKNPAFGVNSIGGKLLRITRYTAAGSGTWTKQSDTNSILVRAVAGGGGGGGGVSGSNQAGNGGYSGCYGEKLITSPAASYAYTVGAAGSGGAVGSAGSAGGNTSFGAMTLTGGPGGQVSLGGLVALPTGSGWDFTSASAGSTGQADSTANVHAAPGSGGPSPFAGGGSGSGTTTVAGNYGSGGGGGPRTSGTGYGGSNGGAGYIEVWEFA